MIYSLRLFPCVAYLKIVLVWADTILVEESLKMHKGNCKSTVFSSDPRRHKRKQCKKKLDLHWYPPSYEAFLTSGVFLEELKRWEILLLQFALTCSDQTYIHEMHATYSILNVTPFPYSKTNPEFTNHLFVIFKNRPSPSQSDSGRCSVKY